MLQSTKHHTPTHKAHHPPPTYTAYVAHNTHTHNACYITPTRTTYRPLIPTCPYSLDWQYLAVSSFHMCGHWQSWHVFM